MAEIDLRHLRAFAAVVDAGSYSKAAEKTAVTQPSLSRLVAQFERHVGHRLIDRSRHPVRMTSAGTRLLPHVRRVLAVFDEALVLLLRSKRTLCVGFSSNAAGRLTTQLVARFEAAHSDVTVSLRLFDSAMAGVDDGRSHVGVIRFEPDVTEYESRLLFYDPRLAVLPSSHPLAQRDQLYLSEIRDDPLVANVVSGTTTTKLWPDANPARPVLPVRNTEEWLHEIALARGVGVGVASTMDFHRHPGVRCIPIAEAEPVPVLVAWPRRGTHPMCVAFARLAQEITAEVPPV